MTGSQEPLPDAKENPDDLHARYCVTKLDGTASDGDGKGHVELLTIAWALWGFVATMSTWFAMSETNPFLSHDPWKLPAKAAFVHLMFFLFVSLLCCDPIAQEQSRNEEQP